MAYVLIADRSGGPDNWGDAEIICASREHAVKVAEREAQGCLDTFVGLDKIEMAGPRHWIVTGPAGTLTISVVG